MRFLAAAVTLVIALAGCRTRCSKEVVDRRGDIDVSVTRAVRAEIDVFESLLDPQYALCIPEVRFKDDLSPDADHVATYSPPSRIIRIYTDNPSNSLIWHELAHALFSQNNIDLDKEVFVLPEGLPFSGLRDARAGEAFALSMEFGPSYAQLLGESCPEDAAGVAQLREVAEYFIGFDERRISDARRLEERAVVDDVPVGKVFKAVDEGWLLIQPEGDGPVFYLDMRTLSVVPMSPALVPWKDLREVVERRASTQNGAVFPFVIPSIDSPTGATRWAFQEPGLVTQAFGCVQDRDVVVEVDGGIWMLRWQGDQLHLLQWVE